MTIRSGPIPLAGPGAEAAVVRIKGTNTSVAISLDGNGRYCALDPREGTKLIVAECCRNLSTVGALPIATTNNLNFGNPERPEIMAQIVESIEGLAEACRFFEVPVTGGNVSLYNETLGTPIFPTPVVGIVGTLETSFADWYSISRAGLRVVLLGGLGKPEPREMGGTQYAKVVLKSLWGIAAAARYGLREARAGDYSRTGAGRAASNRRTTSAREAWRWRWPNAVSGRQNIGAAMELDSDLPAGAAALSRRTVAHSGLNRQHGRRFSQWRERMASTRLTIGATLKARVTISNRSEVLDRRPGRRVEGTLERRSRTPPP